MAQQQPQAVNVNRAGRDDLLSIRGVEPEVAQGILAYRRRHGRFDTLDDLRQVPGMSQDRFEKVRNHLTV